ncbi:MAG TPA: extracellular solute-binding protein, partial [Symbiobacteriaceae bacterium]|nr:extracellular solute-binding protein [Symbiobacteriaceae bacterium]
VGINSDAALDGIMYYTGLAKEGLAPKTALEKNSADVESMFAQGEFAVFFSTPALVRGFYTPNDKGGNADSPAAKNYAVAPIPAGTKGRFTFFGGSNLSIPKSSKHKNESWEVLKFLVNKDTQVTYGKFSGMLPSVKAAEADMKAVNANYGPFYEAMKFGRSYPAIPGWGPLETVLVKHMGNIWDITAGVSGTYSRDAIKKVLDEAAKESNNLLKQ